MDLTTIAALLGGYLLGAIPFGFILVRVLHGTDVRAAGSGSTGATNVTRQAGIRAGLLTYAFDVAKGAAAVLVMSAVTGELVWLSAAALAAIVGHMYPVFLRFHGGKGVATGVGAYLVIAPAGVLLTLVVWALLFWRTRVVSLASIIATALVPLWIWVWYGLLLKRPDVLEVCLGVGVGCTVVIVKHHDNIRRLLSGGESKFQRLPATGGAGASEKAP